MEENHYYPFGLKHENYNAEVLDIMAPEENLAVGGGFETNVVVGSRKSYQYKYQGQERQDELGLNWDSFKYRNYDYAIGRFMSIDPLAEKYPYNSTYAFQENKMGMGVELEGLELFSPWIGVALGSSTPVTSTPLLGTGDAVKMGIDVSGKAAETAGKSTEGSGKFSKTQLESFARGNATETEQLAKNGIEKNTKPMDAVDPKTGKEGTTVPDGFDGKQTTEVKDVKYQAETKQLRLQKAISNGAGTIPRLIINEGAKLSKNVSNGSYDIKTYVQTVIENTAVKMPKPLEIKLN